MKISELKRLKTLVGGGLMVAGLLLSGCGPSEPKSVGGTPDMRRLTGDQYRHIVADVFGSEVPVGGRFDPLLRTAGLERVGARSARITPSAFEQYYDLAHAVANYVTSPAYREVTLACKPAAANAPDDACAKQFFSRVGRLLYRRPLTDAELETSVKSASEMAKTSGDFYEGISEALASMMTSPKFLFVIDTTETKDGQVRLTDYAKAARLSFLLWDTTPDEALLAAAEKGELSTPSGLKKQVDRMMASDLLDGGVRAFFTDFLSYGDFDSIEKDAVIYPAFSPKVGEDAKEQMMRTITNHLIAQNADYRTLFTSRKTFMTATLARVYRVPMDRPDGGWMPYEFPAGDPRGGILSQVGFTALYAHPGKSSSTRRGRAMREIFLCQKVPDPPGDVDFSKFNDPKIATHTARDRLTVHSTEPACAGCHKVTDPIGLTLEHFDGAGQYRANENGFEIDTSGSLDGVTFTDAVGLGKAMSESPAVPACVADRLFSYATGRAPERSDRELLEYLHTTFASDKYRFPELLRRIALSDAMYAVTAPKTGATANNTPEQSTSSSKESRS